MAKNSTLFIRSRIFDLHQVGFYKKIRVIILISFPIRKCANGLQERIGKYEEKKSYLIDRYVNNVMDVQNS